MNTTKDSSVDNKRVQSRMAENTRSAFRAKEFGESDLASALGIPSDRARELWEGSRPYVVSDLPPIANLLGIDTFGVMAIMFEDLK